MRGIVAAMILVIFGGEAYAQSKAPDVYLKWEDLDFQCQMWNEVRHNSKEITPVKNYLGGSCEGSIKGIIDVFELYSAHKNVKKDFCLPPDIDADSLVSVVLSWINRHRSNLVPDIDAVSIVNAALQQNFPCR